MGEPVHDEELIQEHESQLQTLQQQGEERGRRLEVVETDTKSLKDDNILIKDALGIKEKENGDRDRQLKEAYERITEIGEKAEDEDKSLRELVTDNRIKLAKIEGILLEKENKTDWSRTKIISVITGIVGFVALAIVEFLRLLGIFK